MAKTKDATAEAPASISAVVEWQKPAVKPDATGFYHDAAWMEIEADWPGLLPREGFAPLTAEIDASLTFDDCEAIPNPWDVPFGELYQHVCPYVRSWNAMGKNKETGEFGPVPPPAEIGPDAFRAVKPLILVWLAYTLKTLHIGGGPNRKKEAKPSDDGSSGQSGDA